MDTKTAIAYIDKTIELNDLEYGSIQQLSEVKRFLSDARQEIIKKDNLIVEQGMQIEETWKVLDGEEVCDFSLSFGLVNRAACILAHARAVEEELAKANKKEVGGFIVSLEMCGVSDAIKKELGIDETSNVQVAFLRMAAKLAEIEEERDTAKASNRELWAERDRLKDEVLSLKEERDLLKTRIERGLFLLGTGATVREIEEALAGKEAPTCVWTETDEFWATECGEAFTIETGTPADNKMKFCCYCGRKLMSDCAGKEATNGR